MTEYRSRTYLNQVLKASTATNSTAHVLRVMCWQAEFDRPEVTITRPQIQDQAGLGRSTVFQALRFLKTEGSIEVIHNGLGGRSNAPTYRLLVVAKGVNNRTKGVNSRTKGVTNEPPTIDSIDSMSDGPASRDHERPAAGRGGRGIKRGAGGRFATKPKAGRIAEKQQSELTPEQQAKSRRFLKALRYGGTYGEAKRLIEAWDEGIINEPPDDQA